MRSFNALIWRNVTAHKLRSILTALAITLGVGMVLAASIVGQAAGRSASELSGEGPHVALEVFSRDGVPFDDAVLDTLRASTDVELASPSLRVEVEGVDPEITTLTLLGVAPEIYETIHQPELANGTFLDQPGTIVLPMKVALENRLNVGDEITLACSSRLGGGRGECQTATLIVAGRLKLEQDMTVWVGETVAYVPLSVAQALRVSENPQGLQGQIDHVEVTLRPGADVDQIKNDLAQLLGGDLAVVRAAKAGGGSAVTTTIIQAALAMVGVIILLAAGFVILNAFAMSVTGRKQEIGAMRALGMTRRQVMRQVLAEAGLLGMVGVALGVLVGVGLAWGVMQALGTLDDVPLAVPWWGVALSVGMGLGVTLVGALQPARQASHVSPLVAVRSESARGGDGWYIRRGGRVGGILLLILLPVLSVTALVLKPDFFLSAAIVVLGQAGLLLGTILLMPALIIPVVRLVRPLLTRRLATAGRLAADNMGRNKLRAVLTAGALTATLTTIIATSGLGTATLKAGLAGYSRLLNEDILLSPDAVALVESGELSLQNAYEKLTTEAVLDPALLEEIEALAKSGSVEVEVERIGFATIPAELGTVPGSPGVFVDPEIFLRIGNFDFFEGDAESALEWMRHGQAVLLQPIVAGRFDVGVGDTIPVPTPHGEVEFTVAGIGGNGYNFTTFSYTDGVTYFDVVGPSWLGLIVPDGGNSDTVFEQAQAIVEGYENVAAAKVGDTFYEGLFKTLDQFQALLNGLLMLAVIVAALGVVNTMVINVSERWREIALLRAVGATQRQVRQAVVAEAATLGLMAALIATVLSLTILALFVVVMAPGGVESVGMRVDWETVKVALAISGRDTLIAAAWSLVFGPLVAALAAYYPGRQAAAMDVIEATRSERVTLKRTGAKRPEGNPKGFGKPLEFAMAWRNLEQHRLRTTLSALAVALGVAMTVAADVTSGAMLNALSQSEDAQTFMVGLLEQLDSILGLVGVGITLAAGFLVFNAFAMSIAQRRRQIGALRSLGMARRQVMRLVLVEALITGGAGTLVGLIAGPLMGRGTIVLTKALLGEGMFVFAASSASPAALLLAAATGISVTLLSVLIPAWQATRISPLVALQEETASLGKETRFFQKTWFLGPLIILALAVYLGVAPPGKWVEPPWDTPLTISFALVWLGCLALVLPALIGSVGRWAQVPLTWLWGATGRLIADNLGRGRGRVTLTILTLAVALTMIVSMTGFVRFMWDELMRPKIDGGVQRGAWLIAPFDVKEGMAAYTDMDTIQFPPGAIGELRQALEGRGQVAEMHYVIVPELSFLGSSYFSLVADPHLVQQGGDWLFAFTTGDWETAMPIMEADCGVLVTPLVAGRNGVSLGETFEVMGIHGPVECTVAGLGSPLVGASIISISAGESFGITEPLSAGVWPLPGVDRATFADDLAALVDRIPGVEATELTGLAELQSQVMHMLPTMLNALLLLAIVAAALGVVNTTVMSVTERRRELGLLRAVGATRRQVSAVVAGEAALMGLIGGALGLVSGAGIVIILAVTYGGNAWGIPDLDLWGAAWRSVQPALLNGLAGLIAAPLISAGAAYLPIRSVLQGTAIETLEAGRQQAVSPRRAVAGFLGRGSVRTRFVLGTGVLMVIVLAGLITVVTMHARVRIEEQMHDALRTMVAWNTGLIELGLPDDAETLDFDMFQAGQTFDGSTELAGIFDSDALLRFEGVVDDMTEHGLVNFTIADRDNVVLIGLDTREVGTLAPELDTSDKVNVHSERDDGEWLVHATAPIRNEDGLVVGSVRMTVDAREIQNFLGKLRNTLWAIGAAIIFTGLVTTWGLSTPLVRATRQLAAHATGVGRGEYALFDRPTRRGIGDRLSLRTRLTIIMVLVLILMVGVLELVTVPTERRHVEDRLKDSLVAAAEWIGQAASESLDIELSGLPLDDFPTFEQVLSMTETLDLARLQELTDQMRSDDMAYMALIDEEGTVILSDQLALIGEEAPVPSDTRIEETTWRDEEVWVVSTPLRRGQHGQQIGGLRMAMRRNRVEAFLDESRNLFQLTGLIAILAGVLLAQAVGGAVTAPVRQLAAGTRRIAEGDLTVQFQVDTKDELAMLANAYNQMVIGLQEREWLRDMFGRFVSQEVAEAIRTGRVRLEGENRVVSVLFCDIRDFTARSERSTPGEMVALLNEYLPVVVEAAQRHEGTVNKFGGDSTLVIYGAPNRSQESAYQAVLTALEVQTNLKWLNERLVERDEAPLHIGVGINTGTALAGAVGPKERQEYTVIGDTVNLASRIEALNKEYPNYEILISGWTYEALGSHQREFEFADLGLKQIRGKVKPVRVWAVVGSMQNVKREK